MTPTPCYKYLFIHALESQDLLFRVDTRECVPYFSEKLSGTGHRKVELAESQGGKHLLDSMRVA